VLFDTEEYYYVNDRLPPKGMCSELRDLFKFWEISDNISETRDKVAMENNRNRTWPIECHHYR